MHETPTRPTRLLIAWDGTLESRASIPCALALAAPDAHLVLLHIAPIPASRLPLSPPVIVRRAELHEHRLHAALIAMHRLASDLTLASPALTFEILCADGDPAREIARIATERRVELVVAALHHERAMRGAGHRSVAVQLAREATIPTLVVRAGAQATQPPIRRMLCPWVAHRPETDTLRTAARFARAQRLPVRIAGVIDPAQTLPARLRTGVTHRFSIVEESFASQRARAEAAIDLAAHELRHTGVPASGGLIYGPVVESIQAVTRPGDLIVVGRRDLPANDGDRTLARFLAETPAPVLIVPDRPVPAHHPALVRPMVTPCADEPDPVKGTLTHV